MVTTINLEKIENLNRRKTDRVYFIGASLRSNYFQNLGEETFDPQQKNLTHDKEIWIYKIKNLTHEEKNDLE